MKRELKVGDVLVARSTHYALSDNKVVLIIDNEYKVKKLDPKFFYIIGENKKSQKFPLDSLKDYFTIKPKKKETVKVEAKVDDIQVGDEYKGKSNGRGYSIIAMSIKDDFYRLKINGEDYFFNHTKRSLDKNFTKKAKSEPATIKVEEYFCTIICPKGNDLVLRTYQEALDEALKQSDTNTTAYVVQAISQVEQVVNVKQLKK